MRWTHSVSIYRYGLGSAKRIDVARHSTNNGVLIQVSTYQKRASPSVAKNNPSSIAGFPSCGNDRAQLVPVPTWVSVWDEYEYRSICENCQEIVRRWLRLADTVRDDNDDDVIYIYIYIYIYISMQVHDLYGVRCPLRRIAAGDDVIDSVMRLSVRFL